MKTQRIAERRLYRGVTDVEDLDLDSIDWYKAEYINHLNLALISIENAREMYAHKHSEEFDIDWAMQQFESATIILERLRDLGNNKE